MNNCIFCKICSHENPASIVYESDNVLAFLNISPKNKGDCLVVPKDHYELITDVPDEVLTEIMAVVKKLGHAFESALTIDGFNVIQRNRAAAGQEVPHVHFHIVPRYVDDKYTIWEGNTSYEPGEMDQVAAKLKENLK